MEYFKCFDSSFTCFSLDNFIDIRDESEKIFIRYLQENVPRLKSEEEIAKYIEIIRKGELFSNESRMDGERLNDDLIKNLSELGEKLFKDKSDQYIRAFLRSNGVVAKGPRSSKYEIGMEIVDPQYAYGCKYIEMNPFGEEIIYTRVKIEGPTNKKGPYSYGDKMTIVELLDGIYDREFETFYFKNGRLHRDDGPAYIDKQHGAEKWFFEGKLHRVGGPAYSNCNREEWRQNGVLHNTEGPAIAWAKGGIRYYYHGKLHRLDGPALIDSDGNEVYFRYGKRIEPFHEEDDIYKYRRELKRKDMEDRNPYKDINV